MPRTGARWTLTDETDHLYERLYEMQADRDYWKSYSAELEAEHYRTLHDLYAYQRQEIAELREHVRQLEAPQRR